MDVRNSHHVDEIPGPNGTHRYEYDLVEFHLTEGRLVRARRYKEEPPDTISVLGMLDPARPGVPFSLYNVPEAKRIVQVLNQRGFRNINVLSRAGYDALDHSRLDDIE